MSDTLWHGKYRAVVVDINDPERRGRIRVQCPKVLGDYISAWCEPCIPYATDFSGDFYVPPLNEAIWVEFEEGNVDKPIWNGGWYKENSSPLMPESKPEDYRFISFKNSLIRIGETEFIFELRNEDDSKILAIDQTTWLGHAYIGSKTEVELTNLQNLIDNTEYLLVEFPKEVQNEFNSIRTVISDLATTTTKAFNELSSRVSTDVRELYSYITTLTESLNIDLDRKFTEVDNNIKDLQRQINDIIRILPK